MPSPDPLIPPAGVEDIDHHVGSLLPPAARGPLFRGNGRGRRGRYRR